jgi:hypothetical protein
LIKKGNAMLTDNVQSDPTLQRMQTLIDAWEAIRDDKAIFLRCYRLMTANMLTAVDRQEFHDSAWVGRLLHRFVEYYFSALDAYLADPTTAPRVWQMTHAAARRPEIFTLQHLLLGVNAHINYDLVLALVDLLDAEWDSLPESQRLLRYEDHCQVNRVIGKTIDAVQDQVLEPAMPVLKTLDKLMGPVDEMLISRLLSQWRENVWQHAVRLLETHDREERASQVKQIETHVLELGEGILMIRFS